MADSAKDKEEFSDLILRLVESLASVSDRLPFEIDLQKVSSITTFAALSIAIIFAWKLLRAPPGNQRRQPRRHNSISGTSGARSLTNATLSSSELCSPSGNSRALEAVDEFFRPGKLTFEQVIRHKLNEGRKVTCQLLGVILEETSPEELQKHATVRSSVCEVLLEITKFCDLYLMERVIDDESEERVLSALDDAGLFTSGGLTREKVLFCSTENGRTSFVRQLEPDWHIDTNGEIIHQLSSSLEVQIEANVVHALEGAIRINTSPLQALLCRSVS